VTRRPTPLDELEQQIAKHPLPKPPNWSNERAVLKFITQWWDQYEYRDVMTDAILSGSELVDYAPRPLLTLRDLSRMLRSGQAISRPDSQRLADLLDEMLAPKRGRPRKSINERRAVSVMPDAELTYLAVVDSLRGHYPRVKVGEVRDRAIAWTAAKFDVREQTLRNYALRSRRDRRRL